jgi:hypothetical protein
LYGSWFSSQGFQVMCAVGLQGLAFALRREIGAASLSDEPEADANQPAGAVFVPVRVAPEAIASVLEIVWSSGERLCVRPGASAASALSPAVRIYLATGAADLRQSIDRRPDDQRRHPQVTIRCRALRPLAKVQRRLHHARLAVRHEPAHPRLAAVRPGSHV